MDSDISDIEARAPEDSAIESALQTAVQEIYKTGDLDKLTLKRVRADAAAKLDVEPDFFKVNTHWKDKSKEIVNAEVARLDSTQSDQLKPNEAVEDEGAVNDPGTASDDEESGHNIRKEPRRKRSSEDLNGEDHIRKRRKRSPASDDSDSKLSTPLSSAESDLEITEHKDTKIAKASPKTKRETALGKEKTDTEEDRDAEANGNDDDSSELSEVLDEAPGAKHKKRGKGPASRQRHGSASTGDHGKGKVKKKADAKANNSSLSPQEEEIKRLQYQLQKCGVRKVWGRELMKFDSPREKIAHLKGMLRDVGIEGRFSEEKARQIKEQRELKAELEAVQEYSKAWGKDSGKDEEGEEDEDGPPKRRVLARGLQELQAFADDDEESE